MRLEQSQQINYFLADLSRGDVVRRARHSRSKVPSQQPQGSIVLRTRFLSVLRSKEHLTVVCVLIKAPDSPHKRVYS